MTYRPHLRLQAGYWRTREAQESLQKVRRGLLSAECLAQEVGTTRKAILIALDRHLPKSADEKKDPRATQFTSESAQRANALRHSTKDPMDKTLQAADDILRNNLTGLFGQAVETLAVIMNKAPRPEARLRAVQIVLDYALGKSGPRVEQQMSARDSMTWEDFVKLLQKARARWKTDANDEGDEGPPE